MSKPRVNVVWFKCTDLRTHDHAPLRAAHRDTLPVLHLYVFDPFWHAGRTRICGYPKTGVLRNRFQIESVADLQQRLGAKGHELCVRQDISTVACFQELCQDFIINAVFAFREICSEELRIERQVREELRRCNCGQLQLFWGFELYHHDDLSFVPTHPKGAFNSYTAFRKRVEQGSRVRPSKQEDPQFRGPESSVKWNRAVSRLPTVQEVMKMSYDPASDVGEQKDSRAEIRWEGGETAALKRVQEYLWRDDSLGLEYVGATMTMDVAKSCMRDKAMSKLSPWLAHGCISPRRLYEEVKRYEHERQKTKSTYWITHELLWRDFVRFGSIHAGTSMFKIGGLQNQHPRWQWSTDKEMLTKWVSGQTGFPFIDCFMRELQTTGYCNHMGRETAGWFLVGDLGIDWRMGAEWFESTLIDYEPTANWYNWAYRCLPAAGRNEAPGQRLRGLEILKWGTQHDPDAAYIKRWIPELAHLPATIAREPWRLGLHGGGEASRDMSLSSLPAEDLNVSKDQLQLVIAMGFDEKKAAMALHRTWGDADAAVALLLSENQDDPSPQTIPDSDDEELSRAVALSLNDGVKDNQVEPIGTTVQSGRFVYGEHYPKPIIQPVSLTNTEEKEEEARREQSKRDEQIAASKRRKGIGGKTFNKSHWEQSKVQWPAETPTSAVTSSSYSSYSKGTKGKGKMRHVSEAASDQFSNNGDKEFGGRQSGRRWGNRGDKILGA